MARLKDQFTGRDVSLWAVIALVLWSAAALSGSLSLSIPGWVLKSLHSSRLESATLDQLRAEMAELRSQALDLRQANDQLAQRVSLSELQSGRITRRVGALEVIAPQAGAADASPSIDRDSITATATGAQVSFDADGGSVSYTTTPLAGTTGPATTPAAQPMPQALNQVTADPGAYGIALGPPIELASGPTAWHALNAKVGTLLLGLGPVLGHLEGSSGRRIVAGPLTSEAAARELCGRMAQAGIACATVPFIGDPLP